MTTYIHHGVQFFGNVSYTFDYDGKLKKVVFECETSDSVHFKIVHNIPKTEEEWLERCAQNSLIKFTKVPADLSFENFWSTYNYKAGNKTRSEKLWNALTEADKVTVFKSLPKYFYYLKTHKNIEQLYPETYLNQRRFENEFK